MVQEYFDKVLDCIYASDVKKILNLVNRDNVNIVDDDGRTVIFYALLENEIDVFNAFLNIGADLHHRDNEGWSLLHYAANENLKEITELIVRNNVKVDAKDEYGNTPLFRAVFSSQGNGEIIKILLANGADPNNKNDSGVSPFELAKTIGNYNITPFFKNYIT